MVVLWNFKYGKAVPYLLLLITFGEDLGSVSKSTLQNQASNKRSYLKQGRFHKECFVLSVCSLIKKSSGDYGEWKRRSRHSQKHTSTMLDQEEYT